MNLKKPDIKKLYSELKSTQNLLKATMAILLKYAPPTKQQIKEKNARIMKTMADLKKMNLL